MLSISNTYYSQLVTTLTGCDKMEQVSTVEHRR